MVVHIEDSLFREQSVAIRLVEEAVREVVKRWVDENYTEVVKGMDQQAIANLAVADAAAAVGKAIREKIPDKVLHVEGPGAVYQRGILGGLRKIR